MSDRPWQRAFAWLAVLAPFFFLTYNFANGVASRRAHVPTLMFGWERNIPFAGWTILPYWSSDLLYAISLWICRTRRELDLHAKRLIAIQVVSIAFFVAFPLRCSFERPILDGWQGDLFDALLRFDLPFNQAPSLHVGLAVILWSRFRSYTRGFLRIALAGWFVLVALSTLTTYQHHFIDLPTGLWAGLLVIAALPERRLAEPNPRLAASYLGGAVLFTAAAFTVQGFGWLLLWPGFAVSMVAAAYWTGDPMWIERGRGPAGLLLWPHAAMVWMSSRLWTRAHAPKNDVGHGVWVGRAPSRADRAGMRSVVTLAPELPVRGDAHIPMLDLTPPSLEQLDAGVAAIERLSEKRPTLVSCALGYSRSALTAAAWLLAAGHAKNGRDAIAQVRKARPQIVISAASERRLDEWAASRNQHAE